jgi:hypothetical protein
VYRDREIVEFRNLGYLGFVTLRMGVIPIRREGENTGSGSDVATGPGRGVLCYAIQLPRGAAPRRSEEVR